MAEVANPSVVEIVHPDVSNVIGFRLRAMNPSLVITYADVAVPGIPPLNANGRYEVSMGGLSAALAVEQHGQDLAVMAAAYNAGGYSEFVAGNRSWSYTPVPASPTAVIIP